MSSQLQTGVDLVEEFTAALQMIADGYVHLLGAMAGLVHGFLWDRFRK